MVSVADNSQVRALLYRWLTKQVPPEKLDWLSGKLEQLAKEHSERLLFTTFSAVPRYIGKADLQLDEDDVSAAESARSGWMPQQWSLDQVGRSLLLLSLSSEDSDLYHARIEKLFGAADVSEQIALYQCLPLFPHPERFVSRAAEGLRTSIDAVFNVIVLDNPFPGDYFSQETWNQMVLKAVFVGSQLHRIQQLDERANAELARMLLDYAHERWAAKREVTPELWRPVGPFLNEQGLSDLEQVFEKSDKVQRLAAALACTQSSLPSAKAMMERYPDVREEVEIGQLNWSRFSEQYLAT